METNSFTYTKLTNMTVGMQSQQDSNLQVLHGKVLLNEEENRLLFMQNTPRGPRSQEVMRTAHSRLVQTPQGRYTLTFRFSPNETDLRKMLLEEMAKICQMAEDEIVNSNKRKDNTL